MARNTHRQFPRTVQTLNLVHSVSNTVQELVEPFFCYYFFRRMQDQQRIGRDIVVDLRWSFRISVRLRFFSNRDAYVDGDNILAVKFYSLIV